MIDSPFCQSKAIIGANFDFTATAIIEVDSSNPGGGPPLVNQIDTVQIGFSNVWSSAHPSFGNVHHYTDTKLYDEDYNSIFNGGYSTSGYVVEVTFDSLSNRIKGFSASSFDHRVQTRDEWSKNVTCGFDSIPPSGRIDSIQEFQVYGGRCSYSQQYSSSIARNYRVSTIGVQQIKLTISVDIGTLQASTIEEQNENSFYIENQGGTFNAYFEPTLVPSGLRIFDVVGKLAYSVEIQPGMNYLEFSNQLLSPGLYFCLLNSQSYKFVVQ
jgi:hypothetical protein